MNEAGMPRFGFAPIAAMRFSGHPMVVTKQGPPMPTFGQRHPVLVTIGIVFAAGFLFGAPADFASRQLQAQTGFIISGLVGGIAGVAIFLGLNLLLALVITVVQAVVRAAHWQSASANGADRISFRSRFRRNLEGIADFLIQGWH